MKNKYHILSIISFLLLFSNSITAQTYTDPINVGNNNKYYISKIQLGNIDNSSTGTGSGAANNYTYYNQTATVNKNVSYTGSLSYVGDKYNTVYIKIWIDYNNDGDFTDTDEEIYTYTGADSYKTSVTLPFTFTIPSGAATATPRMRAAIKHSGTAPTPQTLDYQAGEYEDYNINILPVPTPPTAICVGSINVNLDVSGTATITPGQINNGSTDDYDAANTLGLSLNKTTFNCNNIGANTVTLTVTDSDGLTDTCTATVNVSSYAGAFTAPTLPTINAFCSYTAVAPIMDYQCGQKITPTTTDPTSFNSAGTYTINWKYNNGSTIQNSTQTIIITNPTTPTGFTSSLITETGVKLSWNSTETGPYKIRYRPTGTTTWSQTTTTNKTITLSGLSNGTQYEAQVAVNASCASYTSSINFTTIAVEYCSGGTVAINLDNKYYISQTTIGSIDKTSGKNDGPYNYYSTLSTTVTAGTDLSGTVIYQKSQYDTAGFIVWIDYNQDGDFNDSGETIYSNLTSGSPAAATVTENFSVTIPTTAATGKTRMRVVMLHNQIPSDACTYNQNGDIEDYDIYIRPVPAPPTAVCIGTLNVNLDVSGSTTITADQINNGSTDDIDPSGNLTLSLDKTTFTCNDLGDNIVTLTVTDSDGLTDTCTATVNITPFAGAFSSPTLDSVEAFCSYTATAPIMDYLCGTQITGTTTDPTTLNSSGTITWTFDNGSTTATSVQTITILTPTTPTNISASSITETTATINWDAVDDGPFKIRYKETSSGTWIETTSSETTLDLNGLNNGATYEVQVSVDATCASYSSSTNFTTIEIQYCDQNNTNINQSNSYYISNTNINAGDINQNTASNNGPYQYFSGTSTNITAGGTISGSITYQKNNTSSAGLVVWIDYNQDGDFDDVDEEVYSNLTTSSGTTVTETLSSILIPTNATTGKTRIRIAMLQDQLPTNACNYANKFGDIEDYDIYIDPRDTSLFEAAMITQVYHNSLGERWIEITNTSSTTIPTNTLIIALYKDTSGDQTGVVPTATYALNTPLTAGQSAIIKGSGASSLNNINGTPLVDGNVTDFDGGNDIIAIISQTGSTAWTNRFDVISGITNNTSYVRNDEILTYNNTYTASEWTAFVNDNLDPYKDLIQGGPERHPNAPLLSEVNTANTDANARLGVHYFGSTSRVSNDWSNGSPDRSRSVIINENYEETSNPLRARKLNITDSNILTITDQPLIVSNDLTINQLASLRLAGTSQLIQTHTGIKQLNGSGELFIDRNTTNPSIYRFSYFSSPVNTIGNTIFTLQEVLKDGTTPTSATSQVVDINFVSGYDGAATSPISIADYWVYTYKSTTGSVDDYVQKRSNLYMQQTDGFTMKGTGVAQNYTYVGTPKDGEITTTIAGYESYLTGNPYPSAISAKKFLEDNEESLTGTLYFWQHVGEQNTSGTAGHNSGGYIGGYATRNKTMGVAADNVDINSGIYTGPTPIENSLYKAPANYIPVGQAFFVQGDIDGGTITYNNSQREYITEGTQSIFFKTSEQHFTSLFAKTQKVLPIVTQTNEETMPIIKLGMNFKNSEDKSLHRQIGISFNPNNSFAYDSGYDSGSFNTGETEIYWNFPNDEEKYVIAGVQEINDDLEVPLEIVMGYDGEIKISIDEWQGINRNVYLKDKETDVTQIISDDEATLDLTEGTYSDRFVLAFKEGKGLDIDHLYTHKIYTKYDSERNSITIQNDGILNINEAAIYNIIGQKINSWSDFSDDKNIHLNLENNIAPNIYILKIYTDKGEISKKIYIQKKS